MCAATASASPLPADLRSAGVTQAEWDALEAQAARAARNYQVSERALVAIARRLGLSNGRFDLQAAIARIDDIANQLADMQAQLDAMRQSSDPAIAALLTQAQEAVDAGDLDGADALLARAAEGAQTQLDEDRRRLAATIARRGDLASLRGDYYGASQFYAQAAAGLPTSDTALLWRYRFSEARAYCDGGVVDTALSKLNDDVLGLAPRAERPQDWAATQHLIGEALFRANRFAEAEAAYLLALQVRTRAADPAGWAETTAAVGATYSFRGIRARDAAMLERATNEYRAALTVFTRADHAQEWAEVQNNLATALVWLAQVRGGGAVTDLEAAERTFRDILQVVTPEAQPQNAGVVLYNIGTVQERIGDRLEGAMQLQRYRQAVETYEHAIETLRRGQLYAYASSVERRVSPFIHRVRSSD